MKIRRHFFIIVAVAAFMLLGINLTKFKSNNVHLYPEWKETLKFGVSHFIGGLNSTTVVNDTNNNVDTSQINPSQTMNNSFSTLLELDTNCSRSTPRGKPEDILCMKPPTFLPNYKNPCWYGNSGTKSLYCLPYFQQIGICKSATTDLFNRIVLHPDVVPNSGHGNKETYWWSTFRYSSPKPEYFSDYVKKFTSASQKIGKDVDKDEYHKTITGDGTAVTFWYFHQWVKIPQNQGLEEPEILTPHLIKHMYPQTKFIIIFRDPTERLYSHYYFNDRGPKTEAGFDAAVNKAMKIFDECLVGNSLRNCLFNDTLFKTMPTKLFIGVYPVYLKEWFSVFPRDQFLILRTEDYSKDIAGHMEKIFKFLDLAPVTENVMQKIAVKKKPPIAKKSRPMLETTREKLDKFYAPFNQQLADMLQDNRFLWPERNPGKQLVLSPGKIESNATNIKKQII